MAQHETTTSSLIDELRLAQANQATRANLLAASVTKNAADVEALTVLIQSQSATLATLGDAVVRLDQSMVAVNVGLAALLEKVTALADNQARATATAAAPTPTPAPPTPTAINIAALAAAAAPVGSAALLQPASPRELAEKRARSDDEDDEERCESQRARAAPANAAQ